MTFFSATSVDYTDDDCNAAEAAACSLGGTIAKRRGGCATEAATFTSNSEVGNVTATVHIGSKRL